MGDNKSSGSEIVGILSVIAFVSVLVLLSWWISSTALDGFQYSRSSDSDATRIYAVFDRATVNYWTKDRLRRTESKVRNRDSRAFDRGMDTGVFGCFIC